MGQLCGELPTFHVLNSHAVSPIWMKAFWCDWLKAGYVEAWDVSWRTDCAGQGVGLHHFGPWEQMKQGQISTKQPVLFSRQLHVHIINITC